MGSRTHTVLNEGSIFGDVFDSADVNVDVNINTKSAITILTIGMGLVIFNRLIQ